MNKRYLCCIMADYSPVDFLQRYLTVQWEHHRRGDIRLPWTLSPSNATFLPDLVEYFYLSQTDNDRFLLIGQTLRN